MTETARRKVNAVGRWVLPFFGVVGTIVASYALLASDAHNDQRYVRLEAYHYDRERDKELRDVVGGQINDRLRAQDKKLDEIAGDVKTLLRESRSK